MFEQRNFTNPIILCKNNSICSMTLLLRNPGFSLDVDEKDNGSIWANDALQWMNRFFH